MAEFTVIYTDLSLEHVQSLAGPREILAGADTNRKKTPAYVLMGFILPSARNEAVAAAKPAPSVLKMLERIYEAEFGFGSWPDGVDIQKTIREAGGVADGVHEKN